MEEGERDAKGGDLTLGPIKQFGRYTLFKKIATGGMAEIWLARQTGVAGFNRFVVIKKILSHLAEEETFRNMFLDEARMSAALTHPNIVQVYDLGEADSTYFIAMEFILGENLAAIAWRAVKRKMPLSPIYAARVIADASKALDYAHRLKGPTGQPLDLVHRDISPQNILVTYEGEVKVVDFGIAKAASKSQHTKTGTLKGKFSYMSPEQCQGHDLDKRSDVFALGIVLYELCTGKRLFKHESELMILEMITKRRITPPSEVMPDLNPDLEAIIMKALEKDVATRYQSAQDLQIALEDFIRTQSEAATNADIAAYMRSLFQDKVEEKRRLMELAMREDFGGQASFSEEPTQQAAPAQRHPQHSAMTQSPQMMMQPGMLQPGMSQAGMMLPPGYPQSYSQAQFMDPAMLQHQLRLQTQQGFVPAPAPTSKAPQIIIGVAVTIIAIAGAYLFTELNVVKPPTNALMADAGPYYDPNGPRGPLAVDSEPQGALISVDDQVVRLADGTPARTPVQELTNLLYGKPYKIKLDKDGFETHVETVVMGPNVTGIKPKLRAIPGRILIEVPQGHEVTVYIDGQRVGTGNIEQRIPSGTVKVTAEMARMSCKAAEETLVVPPGGSARTTVRCTPRGGGGPGPGPGPGPGTVASKPPTPTSAPTPGGCVSFPDQPPGFVTIDTNPPSQIYSNGKLLGDTPLARQKFPAGCVELEARAGATSKKLKLEVKPNATQRYRVDLPAS